MDTKFIVEEVLNPTIYSEVSEQYKSLHKGKDCIVLAEESEYGKMYYYLPLFSSEESLTSISQSEIESPLLENKVKDMKESLGDVRQKLINKSSEESVVYLSDANFSTSKCSCPTSTLKDADNTTAPEDCFTDVKSVLNRKTWFQNACEVFPTNSRYLNYSCFPKSFKLSEEIYEGVGEAEYSDIMETSTSYGTSTETPDKSQDKLEKEKSQESLKHNLKPELLDLVQLTSFIRGNFKEIIKDGEITTYGVSGKEGALQDIIFVVDLKGNCLKAQGTAWEKLTSPNDSSPATQSSDKDVGDIDEKSSSKDEKIIRFVKISFSDSNLHRKNKQVQGILEQTKSTGRTKSLSDINNIQRDIVNQIEKLSIDVIKRESLCFDYTSSSLIKSSQELKTDPSQSSNTVSSKSAKNYKKKKSKTKIDKSPTNTIHDSTDDSQETSSASTETTSSDTSSVDRSENSRSGNSRNCHVCHKVKRSTHVRRSGIFDSVVKVFANYLFCTPSGTAKTTRRSHGRGF